MGQKQKKLAKGRLDEWYERAKQQGYRSRAAFKLIQLNQKYDFLRTARGVLDLCAAPGGWMQVAHKFAPSGTPVVGIDLAPIKPIPGCTGILGDITTPKARADIKRALGDKQCDVVLHDGAPNVGAAWAHDAFSQNELALASLKLGLDFLSPGGWFVTKVFRSADYNSLLYVLKQLFEKVEATKPVASRGVSAEIFVVCKKFLAPKKIDPRLLDPRFAFSDVETKNAIPSILSKDVSKKPTRVGYDADNPTLFQKISAHDYIYDEDSVKSLSKFNMIEFDEDSQEIKDNKYTTEEIKSLCSDIRVLGKGDLRQLLKWHTQVRDSLQVKKEDDDDDDDDDGDDQEVNVKEFTPEELDQMEDEKLAQQLNLADAKAKKRLKKAKEDKRKRQKKIDMKMVLPGDENNMDGDVEVFDIRAIKDKNHLQNLTEAELPDKMEFEFEREEKEKEEEELEEENAKHRILDRTDIEGRVEEMERDLDYWYANATSDAARKTVQIKKGKKLKAATDQAGFELETLESYIKLKKQHSYNDGYVAKVSGDIMEEENVEDDDMDKEFDGEESESEDEEKATDDIIQKYESSRLRNPLVLENSSLDRTAQSWFNNSLISDIVDEKEDEDAKFERLMKKRKTQKRKFDDEGDDDDLPISQKTKKQEAKKKKMKKGMTEEEKEKAFEEVPVGHVSEKSNPLDDDSDLDPEDREHALAVATMITRDKKMKMNMIDGLYNRYAWDDRAEDLPIWFSSEEQPHLTPDTPLTKEVVKEIKDRLKALNARPIKKVMEAKARKKMRADRKTEKMKAKMEVLANSNDMSNADKSAAIEKLYKKNMKALKGGKKKVTYVVSTKGGNAASKQKSTKGATRVVDTRMKKDKRAMKSKAKKR
ncbi:hypothetical protein PROFUN_08063 [Planoprotostelium fungivorum]|uniref:Putative rRNA methyltransferase n=1 Tax=Planoprotostelium fungivorum TaxID=1890364 RepID=A0A2P6NKJ9_9EUKA|nr:hypothetical protein PROFUN_08063 [Planoprotostelium fungivorum]